MKNNQAKLLALVGLIFFPFVAKWLMKDEWYDLNNTEIKFVNFYINLGWLILLLIFISIVVYVVGIIYMIDYFLLIWKIIFILAFIVLFVWLFNLFKNKTLELDLNYAENFLIKEEWFDFNILVAYFPLINYYLLFTNKVDKKYEIYFKEWILWYFILFLAGLIDISFFYLILFLLILRSVGLFFGLNISIIKFFVDKLYVAEKPWGFFAYIEAWFYYIVINLFLVLKWKKTISYTTFLQDIEDFYSKCIDTDKILKYPKKYLFLILSYLGLITFVFYNIYLFFISYLPYSFEFSVLGIWFYFFLPLVNKKLCTLPLISRFLFYILKSF